MFDVQMAASSQIRHLALAGSPPELIDVVIKRVQALSESWTSLALTSEEHQS